MVLLRKSIPIVAWYVLSNVSYINLRHTLSIANPPTRRYSYLVMRLVFPTLWSPSKTIFVRFGGEEEKSAETGVDGVSMGALRFRRKLERNRQVSIFS